MLVYGRTYRLTCCDDYTKKFFQSNGIKLNDPEEAPHDPYTESRRPPNRTTKTKSDFDTLKRFLTLDRKVLRFYAVWDDRDMRFGEMRPFIFHYFLGKLFLGHFTGNFIGDFDRYIGEHGYNQLFS